MNSSTTRRRHLIACAAYLLGWHVLVEVFLTVGIFDFLGPSIGNLAFFIGTRKAVVAACQAGACAAVATASFFVPLAIICWAVRKLFDEPPFATPAHADSSRWLHFAAWLALIPLSAYFVVGPLFGLALGNDGVFDYEEKWQYLPWVTLSEHLSYVAAACLGTRHSTRIANRTEENTGPPVGKDP